MRRDKGEMLVPEFESRVPISKLSVKHYHTLHRVSSQRIT